MVFIFYSLRNFHKIICIWYWCVSDKHRVFIWSEGPRQCLLQYQQFYRRYLRQQITQQGRRSCVWGMHTVTHLVALRVILVLFHFWINFYTKVTEQPQIDNAFCCCSVYLCPIKDARLTWAKLHQPGILHVSQINLFLQKKLIGHSLIHMHA